MGRDRDLDEATAERLLSGRLDPDDAPPRYAGVARAAAEAASTRPATADDALVAAMAREVRAAPREPATGRKPMLTAVSAKVAAIVAAVTLGTAGAAAAAVTGNLPGPVQNGVSGAASHIGLDLPEATTKSHPTDEQGTIDVGTTSTTAPSVATTDTTETTEPDSMSDVAKAAHDAQDATEPGPDRGKAVSDAVRNANGSETHTSEPPETESQDQGSHDSEHQAPPSTTTPPTTAPTQGDQTQGGSSHHGD